MLQLYEDEKILLVIHKHWFIMARTIVVFVVLILLPPAILTFLPMFTENFDSRVVGPATDMFLALYILVLLVVLFLMWMDYYLDMWIITTSRVIDVEQQGLFSRKISEIPLKHVQDVTIEVRGIIETFLKFGTIRIQTAGERDFKINYVPHLYEAKDIIIKYAHEAQKN